jgi:hypothetical protein
LVKNLLLRSTDGRVLTTDEVAKARVERESQCPVLNCVQAEIARGEMAIALDIFGQENTDGQSAPLDLLREWLVEERLPDGWKPTHTQGLLQTIRTARELRNQMATLRKEEVAGGGQDRTEACKLEIPPIS